MKEKKRIKRDKSVYTLYGLLIFFILILIFLIVVFVNQNVKTNNGLKGKLSTLKWESDGIEISLGKENGRVVLSLNSNLQNLDQMMDAIDAIRRSIIALIDNMEANGAPVRRDQFSLDFFEDDKLLQLNFEEEIANTILNGSVLFLEQAADYCDVEIVSNIIDKIEDSNVYDVNLSETNCGIRDIPGLLSVIDLAEMYSEISQTEDFKDISIVKNKNALAVLDFNNYFEYGSECEFNVSSDGSWLRVEVYNEHFLDIFPSNNWTGSQKVFVKLICSGKTLQDSFYVRVNESSDISFSQSSAMSGFENETNNLNGDDLDDSDEGGSYFNEYGSEGFRILNPLPDKSSIYLSINDEETFSIDNENYDTIEWFVDGESVSEGFTSYDFKALKEGKHVIRVKIIRKGLSDSNTWRAVVTEAREEPSSDNFTRKIIGYLIAIVIFIIIIIIILLIFKKRKGKQNLRNSYPNYQKNNVPPHLKRCGL